MLSANGFFSLASPAHTGAAELGFPPDSDLVSAEPSALNFERPSDGREIGNASYVGAIAYPRRGRRGCIGSGACTVWSLSLSTYLTMIDRGSGLAKSGCVPHEIIRDKLPLLERLAQVLELECERTQ